MTPFYRVRKPMSALFRCAFRDMQVDSPVLDALGRSPTSRCRPSKSSLSHTGACDDDREPVRRERVYEWARRRCAARHWARCGVERQLAERAPAAPQSTAVRQRPPIAPQPPAPRPPPVELQTPARAPPRRASAPSSPVMCRLLGSPGGPLAARGVDEPIDPPIVYVGLREIAEASPGRGGARARPRGRGGGRARAGHDHERGVILDYTDEEADEEGGVGKKLVDVRRELKDALWIRMELMERSLADMVGLVEEGLRLQEPRIIARFAGDMLQALVQPESPRCADPVGVPDWQASEVRSGSYDAPKVDVWSVGATVLGASRGARAVLRHGAALYPPAFHEFSRLCFEPTEARVALLKTCFVQRACGRLVIVQLLSRCTVIE
ncbi:hypothetical protein C8J57DRAFT_1716199 [Mycena rebaudengoi]|nr:hypothetical protein C8J57DRAFT_1716199 [Mycena rebaudengoi]